MLIRPASTDDAQAVAELTDQLGYPTTKRGAYERLEEILPMADHAVYVAEVSEGNITAWVHVHGTHHLQAEPYAELGGLVVGSTHHGSGIGSELVIQAQTWATEKGYRVLRVRTNLVRAGAHEFYKRMGFELNKSQHVFVKSLKA